MPLLAAEPGTDFCFFSPFFFFNYNKGSRQDPENMAEKADRRGASQATPRANNKKHFIQLNPLLCLKSSSNDGTVTLGWL